MQDDRQDAFSQDEQLQQLQITSLRERIRSDQASANDYQELGKLLLLRERQGFKDVSLDEITAILEEGREHFPDVIELLEMLIICYLRKDPLNLLQAALEELEKKKPDSSVLQFIARINDVEDVAHLQQMDQRLPELMSQILSGNPQLAKPALQELYEVVDSYPLNPDYRLAYAFGLCMLGQKAEALHQAGLLDKNDIPLHTYHFNLGQVFWLCGDPVKGRHHLDLALQYAGNAQERQDALDRIADLSKGGQS